MCGKMNEITEPKERQKDLIAFGCIAAARAGLFLGIKFPQTVGGVFSVGTILSFAGFLASLGSVKERENNLFPMLAFVLSFLAMSVTIFCSGMIA